MTAKQISPRPVIFPAGHILRSRLASYDELQAEAARWNLEATQTSAGRYTGRLRACHTHRTQLALAEHGCGTRIGGTVPEGTLVFCITLPSASTIQFRGTPVGPGDLFVQDGGQGMDFSFSGPIRILTLAVDRSLFEERAAQFWQSEPLGSAGGSAVFQNHGGAVRAKQHLMDSLARGLNSPQLLAGDEEGAAFEDCLIDGLLGELREPRPPESAPARWKIARRAAGYLHEHCREELHVGDICRATGASRRTLHLGFMELYGVGPMGYLRILRLNGARRELQGARLHGRSVTSVATSWGFTHLSRFAGAYRAHFGVLPSVDVAARDKGR